MNTYKRSPILRGDIFYAELGAAAGSEQAGFRPVVVIQNDVGNHYTVTMPKSNTGKREIPMLTEVRDTLLALYERRNDFNADNQIVIDGYTNFVFRDLYGRVYSNHRINRQLKRITAKYNQEEHAEAEQEGREENPLPPITCHIFIYSDVEADVSVIRAKFNEWRKRL